MRLTRFDRIRGCYTISPDVSQGQNIQKLGKLEDRDTPRRVNRADSKSPDSDYECLACGAGVGSSYMFCPWCGQRLQEDKEDGGN